MARPSFIFFITDQQRADWLGCNGHPVVRTPSIDGIAAGGVSFNRFYVASPGCSLLPVVNGEAPRVRDVVFIQYDHQRPNNALGGVPRVHTLIDGRWRLSMFDGVEWGELYDLAEDPGEMVNLWDAPRARDARSRMIERLAREEIAHVDRVPMPTARA